MSGNGKRAVKSAGPDSGELPATQAPGPGGRGTVKCCSSVCVLGVSLSFSGLAADVTEIRSTDSEFVL